MSEIDRNKWNKRYASGAYAERTHPSAILAEWIERLPRGRALDLACGAGRNALFLAHSGFSVDAVDISAVALDRARARALAAGLDIHWMEHDLEEPLTLAPGYALVLIVRYVNLPLIREAARVLAPGGFLICEEHLATDEPVVGPSNPAFRLEPGVLRSLAGGLEILHLEEAVIHDPDDRSVAVARLIARRGEAGVRRLRNDPDRATPHEAVAPSDH